MNSMRTLYHYTLCPFSRKVRLILAEKKLDFELEVERTWEKRPEFITLNPAGKVPLLVDLNGTAIIDSMAIAEYLDEAYPERLLVGVGLTHRAEVRRLTAWFDDKFAQEVSVSLLLEKVLKKDLYHDHSGPNSAVLRLIKGNIHDHLSYISWLVDRRKWLAGDEFSLADVAAAAHLSIVDYLGDVPWDKHELAKDWYVRIKSRPSFRALLADRLPGRAPSSHYENLDF
ncbi:MAG: glutathione S-transferase family protein [Alphaproteobacteria bacterium]|nr:glutathione S-transferase family protein [Alphaproteobacteria bacterium]